MHLDKENADGYSHQQGSVRGAGDGGSTARSSTAAAGCTVGAVWSDILRDEH